MVSDLFNIFLKISELGSISKASESLYISQPALSQKLKNLEEELEEELFIRSNKGIELTEIGKIVEKYFSICENVIEEMKEEIKNKKEEIIKIKIAATPSICNYILPSIIYKLKKNYPKLEIELYSRNNSVLIEQELLTGRCDIGFVSEKIKNSCVLSDKKIFDEEIVLVCGSANKNYTENIKIEEIKEFDLLKISTDEDTVNTICKNINNFEKYKITYSLDSIDAVKSCLINGYGIAFLPYSSIKKELKYGELKIINIEDKKIIQSTNIVKRLDNIEQLDDIIKYIEKNINETML